MLSRIMKTYRILIILAVAALVGCDTTGPRKTEPAVQTEAVSTGGMVVFRQGNGGFYGILTDKGGQFEPQNLDGRYRTDGLRISFSGQLDTTQLGMHQWGNPVVLASVTPTR